MERRRILALLRHREKEKTVCAPLTLIHIDACLRIGVVTRVVEKSWCRGNGNSCSCHVQTDQYMIIRVIIR